MSQPKDTFDLNLNIPRAGVKTAMAKAGTTGQKVGVSGSEVWNVLLDDIEFIPGYNVPGRPTKERVEQIGRSIAANKYDKTQPVSGFVGVREDGRQCVFATGGHTRVLGARFARDVLKSTDVDRIPMLMQPANVDMVELNYHLHTSNTGDPLTPYGIAVVANRLLTMPDKAQTEAQIAERFDITVPYLHDLLALLKTPEPMQKMLADDKVSATLAGKLLKKEGGKAAAKTLSAAASVAAKEGKTKVTQKHVNAVKAKTKAAPKTSPEPAPSPASKKAAPAAAPAPQQDTAFDSILRKGVKSFTNMLKENEWAEHGHGGDPDAIHLEHEITRLISDLGKANQCIDDIAAVINDAGADKKPRVLALLKEYNKSDEDDEL